MRRTIGLLVAGMVAMSIFATAGTAVAQARPATVHVLHAVPGATALDVVAGGAGDPGSPAIPGHSWLAQVGPEPANAQSAVIAEVSKGINTEPHYPVSRGAMRALIDDSLHYIRNGDGIEELYNWRLDRGEPRDLSASDAVALDALRRRVAELLR